MKKISAHTTAFILGFFPVAIMPADDPAFILMIGTARILFGPFFGLVVFVLAWFLLATLAFFLYKGGSKWVRNILHERHEVGKKSTKNRAKQANERTWFLAHKWWKSVMRKWRNFVSWCRKTAKGLGDAEITFLAMLVGPIFTVPFISSKKYSSMKSVTVIALISLVSGTAWYVWYTVLYWGVVQKGWELFRQSITGA